jgi:hypothetical protein
MSHGDEIDLDAKLPLGIAASDPTPAAAGVTAIEGGVAATQTVSSVAANQAIVEAIATGTLDPVAAQALLLDQVLAEQLPDLAADELDHVRDELTQLLADDPTLARLLRP